MGEAKQKQRSHAELLVKSPFCIYCGGKEPATTIDHMPPAICFRWKHRPKGLEFPSCEVCNNGASHADFVAGLFSRFYEPNDQAQYVDELTKMFRSISTNIPGLLDEMKIGRGGQKIAFKRLPADMDGGVVRVSGPIVSRFMEVFALKMGLALHFETTGQTLNDDGGISIRWFTNYERFTGDFPQELIDFFPESKTLKNGRREVSDQFQYSYRLSDEKEFGAYFASFRLSFAVVAFVAQDKAVLHQPNERQLPIFTTSEVKDLIQKL